MDTHRPPHFDDTNFPYYSARMACYLEVIDLVVWRVTRGGMKPPKNPKQQELNEHKFRMKMKAKYTLPIEEASNDALGKLWTYLEKKAGGSKE